MMVNTQIANHTTPSSSCSLITAGVADHHMLDSGQSRGATLAEWRIASPRRSREPRAASCRGASRWRAAFDGPIQIGHGQTNSQPRTVAAMLRLLDVRRRRPGPRRRLRLRLVDRAARAPDRARPARWSASSSSPTWSRSARQPGPHRPALGEDRAGRPRRARPARRARPTTGSWSPPWHAAARRAGRAADRRTGGWSSRSAARCSWSSGTARRARRDQRARLVPVRAAALT